MRSFSVKKYKGRPDRYRSDDEKNCYAFLDALMIPYERFVYDHYPDGDEAAVLDDIVGVKTIKNLIFRTQNKSEFYFIIMPGDKEFDKKEFKRKMGLKKIAMATLDDLKILHTKKGSVGIIDLIYDKEHRFSVYIDEEIMRWPYFRFHPFFDDTLIRIRMDDLSKLVDEMGYQINIFG